MVETFRPPLCHLGHMHLRTAPFNNMRTLKIHSSTNKSVLRYRQSNVRRLLPAFDYCRARGNQIVVHSSDNGTELGSTHVVGSWEEPPNI